MRYDLPPSVTATPVSCGTTLTGTLLDAPFTPRRDHHELGAHLELVSRQLAADARGALRCLRLATGGQCTRRAGRRAARLPPKSLA